MSLSWNQPTCQPATTLEFTYSAYVLADDGLLRWMQIRKLESEKQFLEKMLEMTKEQGSQERRLLEESSQWVINNKPMNEWKWICIAYCHKVTVISNKLSSQTELEYNLYAAGLQARPTLTGLGLGLTAMPRPGLPFNCRHPRDPCNCMDHYSFTDPIGMEGWVGQWLVMSPSQTLMQSHLNES